MNENSALWSKMADGMLKKKESFGEQEPVVLELQK